jgi:octaprenyl-diphosphate synthase
LHIGLAFQIVDDMLDFTGDSAILGKPTVSDLREGKATLPVLDLLRTGPPRGRELASTIVAGDGSDETSRDLIVLLHECGALDRARARARLHAELAIRELDAFPVGAARRALIGVPDLLISRDR